MYQFHLPSASSARLTKMLATLNTDGTTVSYSRLPRGVTTLRNVTYAVRNMQHINDPYAANSKSVPSVNMDRLAIVPEFELGSIVYTHDGVARVIDISQTFLVRIPFIEIACQNVFALAENRTH